MKELNIQDQKQIGGGSPILGAIFAMMVFDAIQNPDDVVQGWNDTMGWFQNGNQ